MADKERGNIKIEYNVAKVGLDMDSSADGIAKGKLSYALNAAVENFDANSVNYQNELGNELCLEFPENFVLIGKHFINEQNKHIFFITNPVTGDSQIGYMENNDCIYHTLVDTPCLNFNVNYPIHKSVHRITNCSTEIYWTDGYNPRRHLDINNIPLIIKSGTPVCDPVYTSEIDCNQLNIQPNFDIPILSITDVSNTGNLTSGTYQFAVQYGDAAGNPLTSYYNVTNPVPIADTTITSVNFNYPVGKSIVVDITNLDTTGLYKYFNLAVIKTINGVSSVELAGTYSIESSSKQITYTGQSVTDIRLSTSDIFEKFPYYEIAQDLTTAQDILIWSNLTSIDRINYQKIANKVKLQWETYRIPATENYADEVNAANLKSYLRDEIYPFEIQFLLLNGKETDGFHIPGRSLFPEELSYSDIPETDDDFIGEPTYYAGDVGYSPYWKIYNTAINHGYTPDYSSDPSYKGSYEYGEFAYWESTEEYPCNSEVWGELAGQKIRHHKFPDVLVSPIFESKTFIDRGSMVMGNDAVFPIGVKVNPDQIKALINASSLTTEQKSEIVGFRILRGNRSTNKSVIAKGILRNVNKYERDDREYYFPNYPYNDLHEDSFINSTNNAYAEECDQFIVKITELIYDAELNEDIAEISYIDCNSNRIKKKLFKELTSEEGERICAIGKPTITRGNGTVSYVNYDIYRVAYYPDNGNMLCNGWRVRYEHITDGTTEKWVEGGILGVGAGAFDVNVVRGTTPECIEGCDERGFPCFANTVVLIKYKNSHIESSNCVDPQPLPAITDKERHVFNSPETSFGKPFLGDILKLESVIFGKGKAHFTEVKDNAKYRLISKEAQQKALDSSAEIASITSTFNMQAMFAAYQAYLTIYLDGITRRNYAYSFNSIASYDYSHAIPNNQGVKQRNLDIARYITPSVVSVDDSLDINNWQRESSVYLKTDEEIPFPHLSPNMLAGDVSILKEKSRFTISDIGSCNNPGADKDIEVVSYYASLKKDIINQWGQIYSYETVSTGFEYIFEKSEGNNVVFGGDTYINRFAFKTKLPFFIDNRVNAADDSDIFYDEIGNIGYPKYWHSARSILSNYLVPDTGKAPTLTNFISYKAHNFDCPNDTSIIQTTGTTTTVEVFEGIVTEGDSDRTYYDGYFYLFAYGIPNFYCESSYNVDLRQAFNNKEGDFWPHVSSSIPDDWLQETNVSIANDNTYYYNTTYSKQNKENYFPHLPADWEEDFCYTFYPFRAVYSDMQSSDSDSKINNWKIYRATSYFDFPQNNGNLTSLDGIQNRAILARFENKTLLYNNLLTLDTSNPQAAYLGNAELFKGAPPIDFADTDLGYVGSQHKLLLKIPQGQVTVDAKRGGVFLIQGTQATELSGFGSGMNRFFKDHLPFEILTSFPEMEIDNHFNGIGLHAVYDSKFNRVIITKLDYSPIFSNIQYDTTSHEFYIIENELRKNLLLANTSYFCNKSWTVSFNFNTKSWISFHSYLPNFYIAENNFYYSGLNDCCSDFEFIATEIPALLDCTIYGYCVLCDCDPDCLIEGECYALPTTTTTTSSSSTTTTSTTLSIACNLEGTVQEVCPVSTTTTTTECIRPDGLIMYPLIIGFTNGGIVFDSTVDQYVACDTMHWLEDNPSITRNSIYAETTGIYIGAHLYLANGTDDCECVPDGWYFNDETMFYGYVFHVEDCIITEIYSCEVITTTTTTTPEPTTTTTTTTISGCGLEGSVTEVCITTTTTTSSSTTTTTTTCEPVEFEIISVEWGTTTTTTTVEPTTTTTTTDEPTTTTTTTICPIDGYLVDIDCDNVTTTTTTTIDPLYNCVEYGYLYNWYAVDDARNIANTGWGVPTTSQITTLVNYSGGLSFAGRNLKSSDSTYWFSGNVGTNVYGFDLRGASYRFSTGSFGVITQDSHVWVSDGSSGNYGWNLYFSTSNDVNFGWWNKKSSSSIRLVKTFTTLSHGQTGTYTGNDGKVYPTICIGTQEWLASNLAETLYSNGDPIPTVEDNATWAGLTTGAKCAYDNNYEYVGCDEEAPTTTTSTTSEPTTSTTTTIEETTTTTSTTEEVTTTTTTLATPALLYSSHANGETCMEYNCCNPDNFPYTRHIFTPINTILNLYFGVGAFTYSDLEYIEVVSIESDANHHLEYNSTTVLVNDKIYNNGLSSFENGYLDHIITNYTGNTSDLFDVIFKAKFYGYNLSDEFLMRLYLNFSICSTTTTTTTVAATTTTTTTTTP